MANCRTCKSASPALLCANEWVTSPDYIVCEDYEKREMPLAVNEVVYQALVDSISRHPTAEDDPDVIDALIAVREELIGISEPRT